MFTLLSGVSVGLRGDVLIVPAASTASGTPTVPRQSRLLRHISSNNEFTITIDRIIIFQSNLLLYSSRQWLPIHQSQPE